MILKMKIKAFPLKKCFSVPIKPPAKSELSIIASYVKSIVSAATAFVYMPLTPKKKKIYITFFGAYKPTDKAEYPKIQIIPYSQSEVSPNSSLSENVKINQLEKM